MRWLVRHYWGLGDVVLQTVIPRAIREKDPAAVIACNTMDIPWRGDDSVLRHDPAVNAVDVDEAGWGADRSVNLGGRDHYSAEDVHFLQSHNTHVGMFCRMAKLRPVERRPRIYLSDADREAVRAFGDRRYVTVSYDTKGDVRKAWPADRYFEVIDLLRKAGIEVIVLGTSDAPAPPVGCVDLRGLTTPRAAFAWQERAAMHISNPDGLAVSAMALGVPCVIPWGNLCDPNRFWMGDEKSVLLEAEDLSCEHCHTNDYLRTLREGCYHVEKGWCIRSVGVARVWYHVRALLEAE